MNQSMMRTMPIERVREWQRCAVGSEPLRMKVGSMTDSSKLAGAIAKASREGLRVVLLSCGVTATYQAVRALATANCFLQDEDMRVTAALRWSTFEIGGQERTGLEFHVVPLAGAVDDVQS